MTARRSSKRLARQKQRNASLFSHFSNFLLVALVILLAAGWYTSNHEPDRSSLAFDAHHNDLAENNVAVPEFKSLNKNSSSTLETIVSKQPLIKPLPSPLQNRPTVLDIIKTASIVPIGPSITKQIDEKLPPVSRFNSGNGAHAIFTAKKTVIYQEANTQSKQIAVVAPGLQIRSYDEQNGWHHVVVPSSSIIGWAKADTLKVYQ